MKRTRRAVLALGLLLGAGLVAAGEPAPRNRVHLSATATGRVANDTLVARLAAQAEGHDPAALARTVNERVRRAVDTLHRRWPQIRVQSESYTTQPRYHDNVLSGWRVRQSLRLEGQDLAAMSEAIGALQGELALAGMRFTVSPAQRQQAEDAVIRQALQAFRQRARLVAETLGHTGYALVTLQVGSGGGTPVAPMYRALPMRAAAAEAVPPPALEAGEATLTVTVRGEIELQ